MGLTTSQPTANATPDPVLGGGSVTGNGNTGHSSTTTTQSGSGTQAKTCTWTDFTAVTGTITAVALKVDWIQDGTLSDGGAGTSNRFQIEYSINGGAAWLSLRDVTQVQTSTSGTSSASLSTSQDLTTVKVRDALTAAANVGETATMTATVSNIRIEVTTTDQSAVQPVVMM